MIKYLIIICLLINVTSCQILEELGLDEVFQEAPAAKVRYKPGQVAAPVCLADLTGRTVVVLPIKSTMGAGMGEEVVTKELSGRLTAKYKQIKFISDDEASKIFTNMDLWEDYYESLLENYYQPVSVNLGKLLELYRRLNPDYIMGVAGDYSFARPMPPRNVLCFIHVQIWDVKDGKIVWEGQAEGENISYSLDMDNEVMEGVIKATCQNMVENM